LERDKVLRGLERKCPIFVNQPDIQKHSHLELIHRAGCLNLAVTGGTLYLGVWLFDFWQRGSAL
jgi:hypothetical protein